MDAAVGLQGCKSFAYPTLISNKLFLGNAWSGRCVGDVLAPRLLHADSSGLLLEYEPRLYFGFFAYLWSAELLRGVVRDTNGTYCGWVVAQSPAVCGALRADRYGSDNAFLRRSN